MKSLDKIAPVQNDGLSMARNDILSTRNLHVNRDIFLYEPENKTNCDSQKEG